LQDGPPDRSGGAVFDSSCFVLFEVSGSHRSKVGAMIATTG